MTETVYILKYIALTQSWISHNACFSWFQFYVVLFFIMSSTSSIVHTSYGASWKAAYTKLTSKWLTSAVTSHSLEVCSTVCCVPAAAGLKTFTNQHAQRFTDYVEGDVAKVRKAAVFFFQVWLLLLLQQEMWKYCLSAYCSKEYWNSYLHCHGEHKCSKPTNTMGNLGP